MTLPERTAAQPTTSPTLAKTDRQPADQPLTIISHAEMNEALDAGLIRPFGQTVAYAVHYQGTWWIHFERGWIRTDQALADMLDTESARMTAQDAIVARSAIIRSSTKPTG